MRVMFDSNAYDAILAHGDARKIVTGPFTIVTTPAQEDEIRQIADKEKQAALLDLYHRLNSETVQTVLDWHVSRDMAIGAAAQAHCDLLVTDDKSLAAMLVRQAPRLAVLTYEDFRTSFLP